MTRYLIRRLVEVVIALFGITTLIFIILHLRPGGPCALALSGSTTGGADCIDFYGLDQPIVNQYVTFIGNYLHGNLGTSLSIGATPVTTLLAQHLPATALLIVSSFLVQQIIALPLGALAAVYHRSKFDGAFSILSYIFLSIPAFLLGFALILIVAVQFGLLPGSESTDPRLPVLGTGEWFSFLTHQPGLALGDTVRHLILPMVTLAAVGIALDSRYMRAAMLQVLDEEYIRTAKAKGLPVRSIVFKHAFRNALPPIITNMGLYLPALLGTAIVVEKVFAYGGVGLLFVDAIGSGDSPVVEAVFLLSTVAILVGNLLADIAYAFADPRVRYE